MLLGVVWVLVLGIAYRRHSTRSFLIRPLVAAFYGCFLLALGWHAPRSAQDTLARFEPPPPAHVLDDGQWWRQGLQEPRHFDLQARGDLRLLEHRLRNEGWMVQAPADWVQVLGLLDDSHVPAEQPVLPIALDGHPERLLLRRAGAHADRIEVLRIWPAPARLASGAPLWVGRYERMQAHRRLRMLTLWQPQPREPGLPADLRALAGTSAEAQRTLQVRIEPH